MSVNARRLRWMLMVTLERVHWPPTCGCLVSEELVSSKMAFRTLKSSLDGIFLIVRLGSLYDAHAYSAQWLQTTRVCLATICCACAARLQFCSENAGERCVYPCCTRPSQHRLLVWMWYKVCCNKHYVSGFGCAVITASDYSWWPIINFLLYMIDVSNNYTRMYV